MKYSAPGTGSILETGIEISCEDPGVISGDEREPAWIMVPSCSRFQERSYYPPTKTGMAQNGFCLSYRIPRETVIPAIAKFRSNPLVIRQNRFI